MKRPTSQRSAGGFSLLELLMSVSLFSLIASAFVVATQRTADVSNTQAAVFDIESELFDVQEALRRELRRSGYAALDGVDYPGVFAAGELPDHAHTPVAGSRELLYLTPRDDDENDWPDLDGTNQVVWEDDPRAVLIRPLEAPFHELSLVQGDGTTRVLSRRLLAIDFQTAAETGFEIPLRALRYELRLGRLDRERRLIERRADGVILLENGGFDE